MKLFLGVTGKVYHVLPANKIHETKKIICENDPFPCIADLYVNITQLPVIIKFRNFLRRHFQRRKNQKFEFLRIFDRPVSGWVVTNSSKLTKMEYSSTKDLKWPTSRGLKCYFWARSYLWKIKRVQLGLPTTKMGFHIDLICWIGLELKGNAHFCIAWTVHIDPWIKGPDGDHGAIYDLRNPPWMQCNQQSFAKLKSPKQVE